MEKLKKMVESIDHTYLFIFVIYLTLQSMDSLVCIPLLNISYAHQVSWWVLLGLLVSLFAGHTYYSGQRTKQSLWYSILFLLLGAGGFLDVLYVFSTPFPQMWLDPNFVHFWSIPYLLFGYPWTIKEQIIWWIGFAVLIYLIYRYMHNKYGIHGLRKKWHVCIVV